MVDIHSHIIYGVDDGAKTIEESLEMVKQAISGGTEVIVATPHYYRGKYDTPYNIILKKYKYLEEIINQKKLDIEIFLGQEVFLDNYVIELLESENINTINNTSYMLVETDLFKYNSEVLENIYELRIRGIKPILAHPERYKYVQEDPTILNKFVEEGCLIQINSGSIKGAFGKTAEKTAISLIKHGFCNFLGSDAHELNRRNPSLKDAIIKLNDIDNNLCDIIKKNAIKMLRNEDIDVQYEKFSKKKSFFDFFKRK